MTSGRRVCLSIGISDAGGGLDYLGGAVAGAIGIHDWALAMGYQSELLVDEPPNEARKRVDIESVRNALERLLPHGSSTDRVILYFAGHGLISAADNGLWLQSGWHKDKRALASEVLRRRLREFGVKQITIFADACRKLPPTMEFADLTQDGVLGAGFDRPRADPAIDRFTATQDGVAAFMIPGSKPGESDRCVFSGVLLEGLWGQHAAAFSKRESGKVISTSLADYLRNRVPEVAEAYGLRMDPQTSAGFPELSDIYFDSHDAPSSPDLPPWPSRPVAPGLEADLYQARRSGAGDEALVEVGLRAIGNNTNLNRGGLFGSRLPGPSGESAAVRARRWRALKEGRVRDSSQLGEMIERPVPWLVERERERLAEDNLDAREQSKEGAALVLIRSVPRVPGIAGLTVGGGNVLRLWVPPTLTVKRIGASTWQLLDSPYGGHAWQALIEFANHTFGACVLMPGMLTRVAKDRNGIAAVVMQPTYGGEEVERSVQKAEEAIARLASRRLEMQEATELATELRMAKHANPVLGVISAYLYDAIGDLDSIRRMAYFYVEHGQAIPFDIAFLADLWTHPTGDGKDRIAIVPALNVREPRSAGEAKALWTTCATNEVQGVVGGHLPWMRRGWPFIAGTMTDPESLLARVLGEKLDAEVGSSTFTTFSKRGGETLIGLLQLNEAT